jgi:hypothetical protein
MQRIRKNLFPGAGFAKPPAELMITPGTLLGSRGLVISADRRAAEISEADLLKMAPGYQPGELRGVYIPMFGKVLLNNRLWCVETLVHETLHGASIFAIREDLDGRLHEIVEGLTEFYTGFLLQREFGFCYGGCWRKDGASACYCTYQQQVKMWSCFCRFIPLAETFRIYFWNGSKDWESEWNKFIKTIGDLGYPKFVDILTSPRKRLPTWLLFHQECARNFGKEYLKNYDSLDRSLDLSAIKV